VIGQTRSARARASVAIVAALGVGTALAILTVLHGVFVGSSPFEDPDRLVVIENRGAYQVGGQGVEMPGISGPDYRNLAEQRVFAAIGGMTMRDKAIWDTGGRARSVWRAFVTPQLLPLLGARSQVGRILDEGDFRQGATAAALITENLWRRHLGSDPHVAGRVVRLDGMAVTLVGVVSEDVVEFLRERKEVLQDNDGDGSIIVPLVPGMGGPSARILALRGENRGAPMLTVAARLRPEASLASAQEAVGAIATRLAREYPDTNRGRHMRAWALPEWRTRQIAHIRPILWAVGILALLVACASAVGMILADAVRREPEMAVRHALGASRGRLARLVLVRALVWTLPGGLLAVVLAWATVAWVTVSGSASSTVPRVSPGPGLLATAAALTAAMGLALGGAAVWMLRHQALSLGLRESGRTMSTGRRRRLILAVLVTAQVGAATSLGLVAGLLLRSMTNILGVNLGFDARQSFLVAVSLPEEHYATRAAQLDLQALVLPRVQALAGVAAAGLSDAPPLSNVAVTMGGDISLAVPGRPREAISRLIAQHVSPGFFEAAGMRVSRGRGFSDEDYRSKAPVIVVDEAFRRARLGSADALQAGVYMRGARYAVVGVLNEVRQSGPLKDPWPTMYLPLNQRSSAPHFFVVVRSSGRMYDVMERVVNELVALDRRLIVDEPRTLDSLFGKTIAARQRTLRLLTLAAGVVLLLTAFSVSGALGEFVENQTREIAIRKALGASWRHTTLLLWRQLGIPCAAGLVFGCVGGWWLARALSSQLFAVDAADPATIVGIVGFQAGLGLAAAAAPLRRASAIDPASALRGQ
jgi:putative ABC transport system permease protein